MEIEYLNNKINVILGLINENSLNYVAEISIFPAIPSAGRTTNEIVNEVLGSNAVIGNTFSATAKEVVKEFTSALNYVGDSGAHPNKEYVSTEQHKAHITDLERKLKPILSKAWKITGFTLKEGHPFYPVFWDFAFNIEIDGESHVVIGSSSD